MTSEPVGTNAQDKPKPQQPAKGTTNLNDFDDDLDFQPVKNPKTTLSVKGPGKDVKKDSDKASVKDDKKLDKPADVKKPAKDDDFDDFDDLGPKQASSFSLREPKPSEPAKKDSLVTAKDDAASKKDLPKLGSKDGKKPTESKKADQFLDFDDPNDGLPTSRPS